jgi:hypothetical protein
LLSLSSRMNFNPSRLARDCCTVETYDSTVNCCRTTGNTRLDGLRPSKSLSWCARWSSPRINDFKSY